MTEDTLNRYFTDILSGRRTAVAEEGRDISRLAPVLEDNELFFHNDLSVKGLEYYNDISAAFDRKGLRYFFMKSFRSYDYADNDMDLVLVDASRRNEYIRTLEDLGFGFLWNRSILREPLKRFYIRKDERGQEVLPIVHVHFAVSWNGMEFLDAGKVWSRLRETEVSGRKVMVPSPEDEILIMAAHAVHENGYVTIGELLHLKNLLEDVGDIDIGYIIDSAKARNWYKGFRNFISFAESRYGKLTGAHLFPGYLGDALGGLEVFSPGRPVVVAPYFFPQGTLLGSYADKITGDIRSRRLGTLPRELFTFGFIMWLYRYKKGRKFRRHLTA